MNLLQMSFSGAVIIVLVIIIRALLINHLPKKFFLALWGIVLFRLTIPVSIPSIFSIYSFIGSNASDIINDVPTHIVYSIIPIEHTVSSVTASTGIPFELSVWVIIWIIGLLLCMAFFAILYLKSYKEFSTSMPVRNPIVIEWLSTHKLKRKIRVHQSDRFSVPLTFGVLSPIILVPKNMDWNNNTQTYFVLEHEFEHIRKFDTAVKIFLVIVVCIHWFNPFVWIMYILINRDIELSCDETVIRKMGEDQKATYALTLINMEEKRSRVTPFCNSFSKNAIEERIIAIMKYKKRNIATLFVGCILAITVITGCATTAPQTAPTLDVNSTTQTNNESSENDTEVSPNTQTITHESADILTYDNGWPYIHDVITNNTDKTIVETQYYMLAFDAEGDPLKLYWDFIDNSTQSSYEWLVQNDEVQILPHQTEEYAGGWSLYDGEVMTEWEKIGDGEANQVAYALFCIKQVVFDDGTTWENSNCDEWLQTYKGQKTDVEILQNYYPYQYDINI